MTDTKKVFEDAWNQSLSSNEGCKQNIDIFEAFAESVSKLTAVMERCDFFGGGGGSGYDSPLPQSERVHDDRDRIIRELKGSRASIDRIEEKLKDTARQMITNFLGLYNELAEYVADGYNVWEEVRMNIPAMGDDVIALEVQAMGETLQNVQAIMLAAKNVGTNISENRMLLG